MGSDGSFDSSSPCRHTMFNVSAVFCKSQKKITEKDCLLCVELSPTPLPPSFCVLSQAFCSCRYLSGWENNYGKLLNEGREYQLNWIRRIRAWRDDLPAYHSQPSLMSFIHLLLNSMSWVLSVTLLLMYFRTWKKC